MTQYTVGFAFSLDKQYVALVRKLRPHWQAGCLNGIGGHCKDDEALGATQEREFREETGVTIPAANWKAFATLNGVDYTVRVFVAFTDDIFKVETITDEEIVIARVDECSPDYCRMIDNLPYLIPLALDAKQCGVPVFSYAPRVSR